MLRNWPLEEGLPDHKGEGEGVAREAAIKEKVTTAQAKGTRVMVGRWSTACPAKATREQEPPGR